MPPSKVRPARIGKKSETNRRNDFVLPPTVSRGMLLRDGSDREFRKLVSHLLTIATRMEAIREHHGRRMAVSGPQYSLMVCIAHLQNGHGISVGAVAEALHVSSAFVASETGELARRGLLLKRTNPDDRRSVLLNLSAVGRSRIKRLAPQIRSLNDVLFGGLDARSFAELSSVAEILVEGSGKAMARIERTARRRKSR